MLPYAVEVLVSGHPRDAYSSRKQPLELQGKDGRLRELLQLTINIRNANFFQIIILPYENYPKIRVTDLLKLGSHIPPTRLPVATAFGDLFQWVPDASAMDRRRI